MTTDVEPYRLWIRIPGTVEHPLRVSPPLQEMAMRWGAVVLNRERWDGDDEAETLAIRAWDDLCTLGFTDEIRVALVESGLGEIGMTWLEEKIGWEARVMPWEFVIALVTRRMRRERGGRLLTIWRHLSDEAREVQDWSDQGTPFLYVDAVPVPLSPHLNFRVDQQILAAVIGEDPVVVSNPDIARFEQDIAAHQPEILHLSAVEEYEAISLRGQLLPFLPPRPGLCLAKGDVGMETIPNERIAEAISAGSPRIVGFASQSSSRLAALAVGIGKAQSAIGFQDDIDRESMRIFYAEFYRLWRSMRDAPHAALVKARVRLRTRQVEMHGAGLVLWTDRSLIDRDPALVQDESASAHHGLGLSGLGSGSGAGSGSGRTGVKVHDMRNLVQVECEPLPRLNYSLLHNNRDLFRRFVLVSPFEQMVTDVRVRVVLTAGEQQAPWQELMVLDEVVTDLRSRVKVPVLSSLGTLKESVRSAMLVEVWVGDQQIHQSTHAVELLAGDEWTDDDQDRQWLPSFVFPRDPGLAQVVSQAQSALCILSDEASAAFDGYQGLLRHPADDIRVAVDLQVQALWGILAWQTGLSYVNPPPTYTVAAQRVRSPGTVLQERSGTCIDLALLLASCWERIGLRPVILLLAGHALPGYWRSEDGWQRFRRGDLENVGRSPDDREISRVAATAGWLVTDYQRVVGYIASQELWPVEATCLPRRTGFAVAVEEGMANLRLPADFDCLIDVSIAREQGVLPLP